ncbi:MAG: Uma2 family endonuclease [Chloroflexota bacterium]|nr:Uma2 family endonuclease [Chloroflexota bacterium]
MVIQQQTISADRFLEIVEQPEYADRVLELVEGELVEMSKPTRIHGVVTMRLALRIASFVDAHELGEVTVGETGFVLERNPQGRDSVRGLDIAFVNSERLPTPPDDTWYEMGPDLAVEVISPNNKTSDTHLKVMQLLNAGTRLIWLVHPETRTVVAHTAEGAVTLREDNTLSGGAVLPGFELCVGDIFPR